jgi:hypothetical protein
MSFGAARTAPFNSAKLRHLSPRLTILRRIAGIRVWSVSSAVMRPSIIVGYPSWRSRPATAEVTADALDRPAAEVGPAPRTGFPSRDETWIGAVRCSVSSGGVPGSRPGPSMRRATVRNSVAPVGGRRGRKGPAGGRGRTNPVGHGFPGVSPGCGQRVWRWSCGSSSGAKCFEYVMETWPRSAYTTRFPITLGHSFW